MIKIPVNLTRGGPVYWFQFGGSGTVNDPVKIDPAYNGAVTPINTTHAGPVIYFEFNGSGTPGDPFTV